MVMTMVRCRRPHDARSAAGDVQWPRTADGSSLTTSQMGSARWTLGAAGQQPMALDALKAFLGVMQNDPALRQEVLAAATADDVAQIGARLGYEFSGDELLRLSGQKVGRVTVTKQDIPGEYN